MVDLRKGFSELANKFNIGVTGSVNRVRGRRVMETEVAPGRVYRAAHPIYDDSPDRMPINYPALSKECYERNPYVYACITHIAHNIASVPWIVYKDGYEGRDEVDSHPILDLLERPNPMQSWPAFMDNFVTDLMLSGNVFLFRAGPENKPPQELYLLRPDRMSILPGDKYTPILGYVFDGGNFQMYYPADLICHIKFYNPTNEWYGMSPLLAAIVSVRTNNEVQRWNFSLLRNMARPPAAITVPEVLDEEQYQRLRIMIEEMYAGPGNAGRPLILENGVDWKPLALTPNEMNWQATSKLTANEIATVLGVPADLIGANPTRSVGSTVQESRKAFYLETLLPLLDRIKAELNNWLGPLYPDHPTIDYNKDEMEALQEALQQRWSMLLQAYGSGVLSLNEVRYALGYEDIPGGDTPMALLQLMQMGGVSSTGQQPVDMFNSQQIAGIFSGAPPQAPAQQQAAATAAPGGAPPAQTAAAAPAQAPAAGGATAQPATATAAPAQGAPAQGQPAAAPASTEPDSIKAVIIKLLGEENGPPAATVETSGEKNAGLDETVAAQPAAAAPAAQPAANGGANNAQ
jgi:HK97 family phage portal protein